MQCDKITKRGSAQAWLTKATYYDALDPFNIYTYKHILLNFVTLKTPAIH